MLLDVVVRRKAHGPGEPPVLGGGASSPLQFTMATGEILSLFGRSGCGKSTLLRIVAGIDADYDGHVIYDGRRLEGPCREIGLTIQSGGAFRWLTVEENIAFATRYRKPPRWRWPSRLFGGGRREQYRKETLELADLVGISTRDLGKYPEQISGGMNQRMLFARALMAGAKLLLLDEPFSSLDYSARCALQEVVLHVNRQRGTSFLCVSHDPDETLYIAHRVLVLQGNPAKLARAVPGLAGDPHRRFSLDAEQAKRCLHGLLMQDETTTAERCA